MAIQRPSQQVTTAATQASSAKGGGSGASSRSSTPATVIPSAEWRSNVTGLISTGMRGVKKRSYGLIFADDGSGKTTFITRYCPAPVFLLALDGRADSAIEEAEKMGRIIYHSEIYMPSTNLSSDALKLAARDRIEQVVAVLEWAVDQPGIKTIGIDPTSKLDTMFNVAFFGDFGDWQGSFGKEKAYIKRQWDRITGLLRRSDKNVILTARQTLIFENNTATSEYRDDGSKSVRAACDWAGHLRTVERAAQFGGGKRFEIEITRAKIAGSIGEEGKVYKEKDWDKPGVGGPFNMISDAIYGKGNWRK